MAVKSNLTNMVLVLGITCLVCSALLGGAYALTKEPIDKAAAAKTEKAISQVLPHFTEVQYNQEGRYYTATDGDAVVGYAIESTTVGFGGNLTLMVGVTPDGVVYKKACANACIGCGICAKTCTHDAITVEGNIAYIDPSKCKLCRECEAMCPTGAIHGVNFPKPLDKDAVKERIKIRNQKAKEAANE